MRLFVAGATGAVGLQFVRLAKDQGHTVHALTRTNQNAKKLAGLADRVVVRDACEGGIELHEVDAVVSALGAPVTMASPEKRSYREVDLVANRALLQAAKAGGVGRFVYVSVHLEQAYRNTAYIHAHEDFVADLQSSNLSYSIIRPTGIFPAFNDFVALARKGVTTVIGDGSARSNPVHHAEVAQVVLDHLDHGEKETSVGGPEILTRREIAELAFHAIGKRPRVVRIPPGLFRFGAKMAGLTNPRLSELLHFLTAVATTDCVAPLLGKQRLADHFRAIAQRTQG